MEEVAPEVARHVTCGPRRSAATSTRSLTETELDDVQANLAYRRGSVPVTHPERRARAKSAPAAAAVQTGRSNAAVTDLLLASPSD